MSTKTRSWATVLPWSRNDFGSYGSGQDTLYPCTETKISDGHPYQLLGRSKTDIGGPFKVTRDLRVGSVWNGTINSGSNWFSGPISVNPLVFGSAGFGTAVESSKASLYALGTTAIARTTPTDPAAEMAQFLGELHEGVPKMIGSAAFKSRARDFRKAGDEYLNYEFGWVPFVSDIQKFAHAVVNSEEILNSYRRKAGITLKRRHDFPQYDYFAGPTEGTILSFNTRAPTYMFKSGYNAKVTSYYSRFRKQWFEGAYRFYINMGKTNADQLERWSQEANKLLGVRLTPETLWELGPWSWAADWFGNMGDVMHNVSAFLNDGLVMQYGYIMEHVRHEGTWVQGPGVLKNGTVVQLTATRIQEVKTRYPATPYGFGLNEVDFSPRRLAIMGALGLTKGPKG